MTAESRYIKIAVIGAGVRGTNLARKVRTSGLPAVISAVAEPDDNKRNSFLKEFGLDEQLTFRTWEELISSKIHCDAVIIATLDNQHAGPALASLEAGWHILIEKPLSDKFSDCLKIVRTQKQKNKVIAVCHTLRFMEGYRKVKDVAGSGEIGEIIHIEHMEAISNVRFAHNYVRNRWSQEKLNTFLLLHKCSHDIDFIAWLLHDECKKVSSFGSLKYFTPVNAPAGSTKKCTDGCLLVDNCQYNAIRLYVDGPLEEWPARDVCRIHTREAHMEALLTGPFGNCVWKGGNDVVDHQVVMMEFERGATATCTLTGFSASNGRRVRVQGTKGELLFDEANSLIYITEFQNSRKTTLNISKPESYHPEDQNIVNEWLLSVINNSAVTVDAGEALRTHAIVFAAEKSRDESQTIMMKDFLKTNED